MRNIFLAIIILISVNLSFAQKKLEIKDDNYKFSLILPDGWQKSKVEETNKKDVILYTFDHKKDSTSQILILAFKLETVKDLDNFIYVLEKDASLNIPPKSGDYTAFDKGFYDGKFALYKDLQFTELVYYYRTKNAESTDNHAYMLRFISTNYTAKTEKQFKEIEEEFKISN